jgi:hypothetical protein
VIISIVTCEKHPAGRSHMIPAAPIRRRAVNVYVLPFLFAAAVVASLVYVNVSGPDWERHLASYDSEGWITDRQRGWPVTYLVVSIRELPSVEYDLLLADEHRLRENRLFLGHALAANITWGCLMSLASWSVLGRLVGAACHPQYSLMAMLVAMACAAFCAFMAAHYVARPSLEYLAGEPYLPMSSLYRWFGWKSPYDQLYEFPPVVRFLLFAGWACMVYSACSCMWSLLRRRRGRRTDADECAARLDFGPEADSAGKANGIRTMSPMSHRDVEAERGT